MPQPQLILLQLQDIERPGCPQCGGKMTLASIEPNAPGIDQRTSECDTCRHVEITLVKFN